MDEKKRSTGEYQKMKAAFEDNNWPVPSPQSFHHWTLARQVDHLVTAREAEPDLGFMARMLTLCSLPRTNPGRRKEYVRRNGPYTLVMTSGYNNRLPYGNLPRLLMAWVSTEAVRTQNRELILGRSLSEFMRKLDISSTSGGTWGNPDPAPEPNESTLQCFSLACLRGGRSSGEGEFLCRHPDRILVGPQASR